MPPLQVGSSPDAGLQGVMEKRKAKCEVSGCKRKRWIGCHKGSFYRRRQEQELVCPLALPRLLLSRYIQYIAVYARV